MNKCSQNKTKSYERLAIRAQKQKDYNITKINNTYYIVLLETKQVELKVLKVDLKRRYQNIIG